MTKEALIGTLEIIEGQTITTRFQPSYLWNLHMQRKCPHYEKFLSIANIRKLSRVIWPLTPHLIYIWMDDYNFEKISVGLSLDNFSNCIVEDRISLYELTMMWTTQSLQTFG